MELVVWVGLDWFVGRWRAQGLFHVMDDGVIGGGGRVSLNRSIKMRTSSSAWAKLWLASTSILPLWWIWKRSMDGSVSGGVVVVRVYVRVLAGSLMCGYGSLRPTAFGGLGIVDNPSHHDRSGPLASVPSERDARRNASFAYSLPCVDRSIDTPSRSRSRAK